MPFFCSWRLFLFFLLLIIAMLLLNEPLTQLFKAVSHREGSSHGILVPFISLYVLWLNHDRLTQAQVQFDSGPGVMMLCAALGFYLLSLTTHNNPGFAVLFLLFFTGGLILILFGREVFLIIAFPLFFIATMIPLPPPLYNQIAEWMRAVTTWGSVGLTKFFGIPVFRDGYDVHLANRHLFVAVSCSGIRYLLSYFSFSLVYAFLFKDSLTSRLSVILGSIPLAVIAGVTRLTAIYLAVHFISPSMADARPHIIISWIVFAIWLVGIITVDHYLSRPAPSRNTTQGTRSPFLPLDHHN